jgi:hypothetical protein
MTINLTDCPKGFILLSAVATRLFVSLSRTIVHKGMMAYVLFLAWTCNQREEIRSDAAGPQTTQPYPH